MGTTKPFIVTSAARSGTHWVTQALQSLGIDADHENAFCPTTLQHWDKLQATGQSSRTLVGLSREKRVAIIEGTFSGQVVGDDPPHDGDVSWLAAPYLSVVPTMPVVHLVRSPLAVVKSLYGRIFTNTNAYTRVARKHMGYIPQVTKELDLCLQHWWKWNHMIEGRADVRANLETLVNSVDAWVEVLAALGHIAPRERIAAMLLSSLEKDATQYKADHPEVSWDSFSLPWLGEVRAMADRYGYADESN